jgi:hypothetical protein
LPQFQQRPFRIIDLLGQHQVRLLERGSASRLLIAGEIEEVLPLDDAAALAQAKPVTPAGEMKFDPAKGTARQDEIVRAATGEPFPLVFLGGAHDPSERVRRVGGGACEYLRVTTKRARGFAD